MKWLKKLDNTEEFFCAILLITMAVINFGNVVSRYFLHYSWSFTEEILMIMFLWCTMFGTVVAFKRLQHLGLTILVDNVPDRIKFILLIFSAIVSCVLLGVLGYVSIEMIQTEIAYGQTTPVLKIPEPIATVSIPLCCALGIFRIICVTAKDARMMLQYSEAAKRS